MASFSEKRSSWTSSSLSFLKRSVIEPIVFLHTLAGSLRATAILQLQQDKICMQKFNGTADFCHYLSTKDSSKLKDDIVSSVSEYTTYKEFLVIIPAIITALFVGIWCDRYASGKKWCILSTAFAQMLETFFMLVNALCMTIPVKYVVISGLPPSIFGNDFGFFTALYAYTAVFVRDDEKGTRFILIPLSMTVASTLGNYLAGILIGLKPMFNEHQLQNYAGNFTASLVCSLVLLTWSCLSLHSNPKTSQENEVTSSQGEISCIVNFASTSYASCQESSKSELVINRVRKSRSTRFGETLVDMFHYRNLTGLWITCFKKREGTLRLRMWLMVCCINLALIPYFGRMAVVFPLVQKLYKWDSVWYSYVNSIAGLLHIFGMIGIIPLLFKVLKVNDVQTSMVGFLFGIIGDVFLGSLTSSIGFYVHAVISTFSLTGGAGCRSYISKIMPNDEVSQVFAVTLVLEAAMQAISSVIFTVLLKLTIHSYPTFVFHFMGVILLWGLIILVYTDLITPVKQEDESPSDSQETLSH